MSEGNGVRFTRRTLIGTLPLAAASLAGLPRFAAAADYPSKPFEMIIPFAPGGGVDLFGRTVAKVLTEEKIIPQRIQITNMPGAGGAMGMAQLVQRKGDPYTLLAIALHVHLTPLLQHTPHSYKDLTPIAKIHAEYDLLVVRQNSPIKNLKQIEEALKKDAGSLSFGGATVGNSDHLTIATFAQTVGVDPTKLTYVAYSGGESNAAILGGHVDAGLGGHDLMGLVDAGRMRVLAISSPERLPGRMKDIPTFREQGYEVVFDLWRGIFMPPGISPEVVKYWQDALGKMVKTAAWKAELEKNQWIDAFDAATFASSLDAEHEKYRAILQKLGLVS